jgi:hypothetical protein
MEAVKDILIQGSMVALIGFLTSILIAWVKKGQFESWGIKLGRWLSMLGNTKLGKDKWEKVEDVITLSILSFAKGLKIGADEDDNGKLNRIEDKLNNGGKVDLENNIKV